MTDTWPLTLMYHGVIPKSTLVDINALGMLDQDAFARHLEQLKKHYQVLHPEEFAERLASGRSFPKTTALVTLDDGFQNVLTYALPVAEAVGVPLLAFICTAHLDRREWLWFSRYRAFRLIQNRQTELSFLELAQLPISEIESILDQIGAPKRANSHEQLHCFFDGMDSNRLRQVVRSGILSIGGHTVRHPILTNELPEIRIEEIMSNKEELERITNLPVRLFAYPRGVYSEAIAREVQEAGYVGAFVADSFDAGLSDSLRAYQIPRIGINQESMFYFWWRVLGAGAWFRKVVRIGTGH